MHITELFVGDVGIYLGGGDIAVTQEFLHRAEVGAVH